MYDRLKSFYTITLKMSLVFWMYVHVYVCINTWALFVIFAYSSVLLLISMSDSLRNCHVASCIPSPCSCFLHHDNDSDDDDELLANIVTGCSI